MVKLRHLWYGWFAIKRLVLISSILLLMLGFWLHASERSLAFAKPWILAAVNSADAPYTVSIGEVTIDWTNAALLGKMHITNVTVAKRDGNAFAVLPELYATIDPIGFLPTRHLLHKVILRKPKLLAARSKDGAIELGVEGSPSRIAWSALAGSFGDAPDAEAKKSGPLSLPFHDFIVDDATLTFTDEMTDTKITSTPFDFRVSRRRSSYEAAMTLPFTFDDAPVKIVADYRLQARGNGNHVLNAQLTQFPAKLICLLGSCPDKLNGDGVVNAQLKAVIADDFSLHQFHSEIAIAKLTLVAPKWFPEPLKLTDSHVTFDGDLAGKEYTLTQSRLQLEDTTVTATGHANQAQDGWYVVGNGESARLDIDRIYKYWPLFLAPDSRNWVTAKLKSGYATKGTLKINFIPVDITGHGVRDEAVDATAEAHGVGFEYLPGFPPVDRMDGVAHFTGKTVRVEGGNGSMMGSTKITHAVLWCPQLDNPKNPMEVELSASVPATDAASILALKYFTFDDAIGLDPETIKGSADVTMKLKFDAFSGNPQDKDPNALHLDHVGYDITANLRDLAQEKLAGGSFNLKAINGKLKAANGGMGFDGQVSIGETGSSQVSLNQSDGKPMRLEVKGLPAATAKGDATRNDFTLTYQAGDIPQVTLRGARADVTRSFGAATGTSPLKNFPAIDLDAKIDELLMAPGLPFRDVAARLRCSKARCESADFSMKAQRSVIRGGIETLGGARQFLMTATDAGSMLSAFDITDRMTRGHFELRGTYNDKLSPPQLDAKLRIEDFTLKNSKILGRIFAIGSLTGLQNALTGSGISFDRMTANIASRGGVITIDKGLASGTAMGITTGGTIDTATTGLALKGVVIPAYALNSILGRIPIIGMIAGGEEGLIAFNYSVKGTYADPDVSVNPLSGLTPGFLRGIFGVFDSKPAKDSDNAKPAERMAKSKPVGLNQPSGVEKR